MLLLNTNVTYFCNKWHAIHFDKHFVKKQENWQKGYIGKNYRDFLPKYC